MPFANLSGGVSFYFEDYGVPPSNTQTYTTLVMLHGSAFHSATFHRLVPFAHKHDIRLVLLNRRGYPNTTPFTASELQCLDTGDVQAQSNLLASRGSHIAEFLVCLLGWSLGNSPVVSFLAHVNELTAVEQAVLETNLRTVIVYDPPSVALGLPPPPGTFYIPLQDENIPIADRLGLFMQWVSSYNTHPISSLEIHEEIASQVSFEPMEAEMKFQAIPTEVYFDHFMRAYFPLLSAGGSEAGEDSHTFTKPALPEIRVRHIWCDMSLWNAVWSAWYVEKMLAENGSSGGRDVELILFKGVNHFGHWDRPEEAMALFASLA
ncbi:hypothetical protein A0H81_11547 [Grifola frondosa]|uniref:AB hydrolase-1 domain-containing protein n=1 Tax=Grifola frondosa TaxID=5627 RepID=A0A1C7LUI0_GRIFR|nr:hypothetical protein A0H81_11547 [Grifola frondosa]